MERELKVKKKGLERYKKDKGIEMDGKGQKKRKRQIRMERKRKGYKYKKHERHYMLQNSFDTNETFYGVQFLNKSEKSFVIFYLLFHSAQETFFYKGI